MTYGNDIILFAHESSFAILVFIKLSHDVLTVPCDHVPPSLVYMSYNHIENW